MSAKTTFPAGWHRPNSIDFAERFEKIQRHAPTTDEIGYIEKSVRGAKRAKVNDSEEEFEHIYGMLDFLVKNGRGANSSEAKQILNQANTLVGQYRANYADSHKSSIGSFLSGAASLAGRAVHSATSVLSVATGVLGKGLGKIPFVGEPLHSAMDFAVGNQFKLLDNVAGGMRLDKAGLAFVKQQASSVKEVTPYVQTILATAIPVAGNLISGAIGVGIALSEGRPITDSVVSGFKDSLPAGISQAVFSTVGGIVSGKSISETALEALPIPESQKEIISQAVDVTKKIGNGNNLADVALSKLPPEIRSAVTLSVAVAHGQNIQKKIMSQIQSPDTLNMLAKKGEDIIGKNSVLASTSKLIGTDSLAGFKVGTGIMRLSGVNQQQLAATRKVLRTPAEIKGFDTALAVHIGMVTNHQPVGDSAKRAGFYLANGLRALPLKQKTAILKTVAVNPQTNAGINAAVARITAARKGWWVRIKEFVGIK